MPCKLVEKCKCFRATCWLHLHMFTAQKTVILIILTRENNVHIYEVLNLYNSNVCVCGGGGKCTRIKSCWCLMLHLAMAGVFLGRTTHQDLWDTRTQWQCIRNICVLPTCFLQVTCQYCTHWISAITDCSQQMTSVSLAIATVWWLWTCHTTSWMIPKSYRSKDCIMQSNYYWNICNVLSL